jgi:hydroxypyruvate isomerase
MTETNLPCRRLKLQGEQRKLALRAAIGLDFPGMTSRRSFLATSLAAASLAHRLEAADASSGLKGRIHHSACKWCYKGIPLDELCTAGKEMGLTSIDLVDPADFPTLKKHGLTSAMISFPTIKNKAEQEVGSIPHGFNDPANHDLLLQAYEPHLKASADFGAKHVICFSGNRNGMDDETGLKNCVAGLQKVLPLAEKLGVTLVMELLNSRVNHPDYQCDKSAWGVELCKRLGSPHFKLLFDIYHMQIMEGDIIATIKRDHQYFAHYHTGGVPGRAEIDETQELHYPAIMRAIVDTGYQGHVAQEFIPAKPDKLASLKQAVGICDV